MAQDFMRVVEDFTCEHCGQSVEGDGYTNHCPKCLWSRHVDINPGDRAAACGAMMEPIGIEKKNGEIRIVHTCRECGIVRNNRRCDGDNEDLIIELSRNEI